MRPRWPVALVCVAALAPSGGARAATVTFVADPDPEITGDTLSYHAAPGERNALTVRGELIDDETWLLTDRGAAITAPESCARVDSHTVRCAARPDRYIDDVEVDLGDGDDSFESSWVGEDGPYGSVFARGGGGDDNLRSAHFINVLRGGDGNDRIAVGGFGEGGVLNGGPGDDRLYGSRTFDMLNGGGGRDELYGRGQGDIMTDGDRSGAPGDAGPGPDLFVGGGKSGCCLIIPGDRVSYRSRTAPLLVDLADDQRDGEAGEGDVLVGVESVEGGHADDRLLGDRHANALIGRGGDDLLAGRGRSDTLMPGRGDDRVLCGAGRGDVAGPTDLGDRLSRGCAALDGADVGVYRLPARPRLTATGGFVYAVTCPYSNDDDASGLYVRCAATVHLREAAGAHRLLGVGWSSWGEWGGHDMPIVLTALGRRLTVRPRGVLTAVRLGIRQRDDGELFTRTERWMVRLPGRRSRGALSPRRVHGARVLAGRES